MGEAQSPLVIEQDFWIFLDRLVSENQVVIDRPRHSPHPEFADQLCPVDYGYLKGARAIDCSGVDIWLGSLRPPELDALVLTVDLEKGGAEIKLLLGCDEHEKHLLLDFLNQGAMRAALVRRENGLAWLTSRRSVRSFQPRPVPDHLLNQILETASWAPSAHNRQPWRFVVLSSQESRENLISAMSIKFLQDLLAEGCDQEQAERRVQRSRQRIQGAPTAILLCLDLGQSDLYPDPERQQAETCMGIQSAALAGGYIQLAAHVLGLASVWMCAPLFAPQAVQVALSLPQNWQPQALLLLGYPDNIPTPRPRLPLEEITLRL